MRSQGYFDKKYVNELKQMFNLQYLGHDILAGVAVALVAIPLSLAIALASGVPPSTALISSIIGGFIAALFGGTTLGITGPAVAMSVLISQCMATYGMSGLLIMGMLCGILQIIFGAFKLGRFTKLIPSPVVAAFIAAIGFIILVGELPKALQIPYLHEGGFINAIVHINDYAKHVAVIHLALALVTITLIIILPRLI
ncbi:MAG: SulP family inorganic anion transporter, partial [Burkholderiales bacterium]|nr:SulP family inorganic anion transporter [Burkholderiales bacterium]